MNNPISLGARVSLVVAWIAVLIGSALPEIVFGFRYPLRAMHWLSLSKDAFFLVLFLLSISVRKFSSLRALAIVLFTLQVATGAFGSIVGSIFWRQRVSGIESSFIKALLDVQFVRVGVTLVVLMALFAIYRVPSRFYFIRGDMSARASRVRWLGISGASGWTWLGTVLTVILSLGTFAFLFIGMRPAFFALPEVISMLPVILLFSTTNALGEEITYRLALLTPAIQVVPLGHAMMMSAAYFGLAHYYGIPSGPVGVIMAGFLGWIACRAVVDTKGVAWAFIMHFVQDIWIFWFVAAMYSLSAK